MAKTNPLVLTILIVVGAIVAFNYLQPATDSDGGVPLGDVVQADIKLYAQDKYVPSTSITAADENATLIQGGIFKIDQLLNGGSNPSVTSGVPAIIMFGTDDEAVVDDYYAARVDFTPAAVEGTQDVQGQMCQVDTDPTITVKNENDQIQSTNTNNVTLAADGEETITVKIKAGSDECYGNPDASGDNALCFLYNTTTIQSVETNTGSTSIPYAISSVYSAAGKAISCYKLDKIADTGSVEIPVTIKATSTEPGSDDEITIYTDDIALFINADTNTVEEGFQDEDNTALGDAVETATINIQ